jgi:hypothetical protein
MFSDNDTDTIRVFQGLDDSIALTRKQASTSS